MGKVEVLNTQISGLSVSRVMVGKNGAINGTRTLTSMAVV